MSRFDESSFRFRFRFDDFALFHRLGMCLGIADIVDGIFDVVRGLVGADGLDDLRRDAYHHRTVRDDHPFRHQRPAPMMQFRPMTQWLSRVACIPMRLPSPTVQP